MLILVVLLLLLVLVTVQFCYNYKFYCRMLMNFLHQSPAVYIRIGTKIVPLRGAPLQNLIHLCDRVPQLLNRDSASGAEQQKMLPALGSLMVRRGRRERRAPHKIFELGPSSIYLAKPLCLTSYSTRQEYTLMATSTNLRCLLQIRWKFTSDSMLLIYFVSNYGLYIQQPVE